jgi:biotin transport system substrate-specific component
MQRLASHPRVLVDAVWSDAGLTREVVLVLTGALAIAAAAQIRIPIPFSLIPITGQTFAVLLMAALYGSSRATMTATTYIVMGALGLPFFAGGGGGLAYLAGPTTGYLAGFVGAAWLVGTLSERGWSRRPWMTALAMGLGSLVIFACGVLWLSRFVGLKSAIVTGFFPFIPGDLIKIGLAMAILPAAWKARGIQNSQFRIQNSE